MFDLFVFDTNTAERLLKQRKVFCSHRNESVGDAETIMSHSKLQILHSFYNLTNKYNLIDKLGRPRAYALRTGWGVNGVLEHPLSSNQHPVTPQPSQNLVKHPLQHTENDCHM